MYMESVDSICSIFCDHFYFFGASFLGDSFCPLSLFSAASLLPLLLLMFASVMVFIISNYVDLF